MLEIEALDDVGDVSSLIDMNGMSKHVLMYLKTNVVVHWSMNNFKHALKMVNNSIKVLSIGSTDYTIIHEDANDEIDGVGGSKSVVYAGISIECFKKTSNVSTALVIRL